MRRPTPMPKKQSKELTELLRYQQSLLSLMTQNSGGATPRRPAAASLRQISALVQKIQPKAS